MQKSLKIASGCGKGVMIMSNALVRHDHDESRNVRHDHADGKKRKEKKINSAKPAP